MGGGYTRVIMGNILKKVAMLGVCVGIAAMAFFIPNHQVNADSFSGNVWFFWNCGGNFCSYKLTGLTAADEDSDGNFIYHTNYIEVSSVVDGTNTPDIATLNESEEEVASPNSGVMAKTEGQAPR